MNVKDLNKCILVDINPDPECSILFDHIFLDLQKQKETDQLVKTTIVLSLVLVNSLEQYNPIVYDSNSCDLNVATFFC